jgi:hypothetical protein
MKNLFARFALAAVLGSLFITLQPVLAQGTAFTYQGRLNVNGTPANGSFDLTFSLFETNSGGTAAAGPVTNLATAVSNGLFTTTIDFGAAAFNGLNNWLQIAARTNGGSAFSTLAPRQRITPAPYAIYSEISSLADNVLASSVSPAQLNTPAPPVSGQVLAFSGGGLVWTNPASGGSAWSLTGNAGTTGADFLGTTDDEPLQLRVNNTVGLALYPGPNNTIDLAVGPGAEFEMGAEGVNVFGGYYGGFNTVYPNYSTIAGGFNNTINSGSPESVIAGGQGNVISGGTSAIGGGYYNTVSGQGGAIPGGFNNVVAGSYGFAAGIGAQASNSGAFVWADNSGGTFTSTSNNQFSVRALGGVRFVTGGAGMTIDGQSVSPGGGGGSGSAWSLTGNAGTVPGVDFLGTTDNEPLELWVNGMQAFTLEPAGGQVNVVGGVGSSAPGASGGTISGGIQNTVSNLYPAVGGGEYNTAGGNGATVGGGYNNTATGNQSTIAGGTGNFATATGAVVGGGGYDGTTLLPNTASGAASTIAGGIANNAFYYAAVGGGWGNYAGGYYSAIVGGYSNNASTTGAFVGGGYFNTASGFASMVPGGLESVASGSYSFAAGDSAVAANNGAFVWADASSGAAFSSTANNQFNVRAYGGVRFVTGGAGMTLDGVPVVPGGGGGGSASNAWLLTGNAGADPADGYFLGTTDANGLELHVNANRGLRLDYVSEEYGFLESSYGVNVNGGYWENVISNAIGATIAGGGNGAQAGDKFFSYPNVVEGDFGTIGGGYGNTAGNTATVPGGYGNIATGTGSFAAGQNAQALDDACFVWGDGSATMQDNGPNRFDALASAGAGFWSTPSTSTLYVASSGFVGINQNFPQQQLEVNGAFMMVDGVQGTQSYIGNGGSGNDVEVGSLKSGITAVSMYNHTDNAYMHVYCSSITIEGGSDLAEPFPISSGQEAVPEGAVVIIDEEHPGKLKMSDQPYDTRVAGVVSGAKGLNPGIQMQQQGLLEGGKNVALTGRVYVQAEASNGSIKPGDLLTTSAAPGRAMRVNDHSKAEGAILGKAMTGLKEGQGMILMLVTLQ